MAIIYDARGNPVNVGFPDAVTGETITDARTITATLAAANAELLNDLNGANTVSYDVRTAAGSLTFIFEGTRDGTNYFAIPAFCEWQLLAATALAEQYVSTVTPATTMSGNYSVNCAGLRRVRLRVSAYTSGNIVVASRASAAILHAYSRPIPATLWITATAAANTNAVATLPAAGAGLFHYITMISGVRNATSALIGSATLIHTSTNLPGTPAWSVGNAMALGGTQVDIDVQPAQPVKSLLANTATTITMVAGGAAVLNRLNVAYYVGI